MTLCFMKKRKKSAKQKVEDGISEAISTPPAEVRETNQAGIDLIKKKEGLYLESYLCPAKVWTIGYGTIKYPDGFPVLENESCTKEQAEEFLRHELDTIEYAINNFLVKNRILLNENQFSALVSFAYNLGTGRVTRSGSVYRALIANDLPGVTTGMMLYCKVKARRLGIPYMKTLRGLQIRRQEEKDLFWT